MQNYEVRFVDSKHYRGDDRRQYKRFNVSLPAKLIYNEAEKIVKVLDLSMGGCRMVVNEHCNPQSNISMIFYTPSLAKVGGFEACVPVYAKVVHSHHYETREHFIINVDFRGALFHEHGVEQLIKNHEHDSPH